MKVKRKRVVWTGKQERKLKGHLGNFIDDLRKAGANVEGDCFGAFCNPNSPSVRGISTLWCVVNDPFPTVEFFGLGRFNNGLVKLEFYQKPGYVDESIGEDMLATERGVA